MTPARMTLAISILAIPLSMLISPLRAEAGDAEKGKSVYGIYCVTCHGEKGDGKGPAAAALNPPPRDFSQGGFQFDTDKDGSTGTDADLAAVIKNGAAAFGGSPLMTPWAHLSDPELQDLIAFIRKLQVGGSVAASSSAPTAE